MEYNKIKNYKAISLILFPMIFGLIIVAIFLKSDPGPVPSGLDTGSREIAQQSVSRLLNDAILLDRDIELIHWQVMPGRDPVFVFSFSTVPSQEGEGILVASSYDISESVHPAWLRRLPLWAVFSPTMFTPDGSRWIASDDGELVVWRSNATGPEIEAVYSGMFLANKRNIPSYIWDIWK